MDPMAYGQPWWLALALSGNDTNLVIPSPTVIHRGGISGGGFVDSSAIVITGIHYDLTSAGFDLISREPEPVTSPGEVTDRIIWTAASTGAVSLSGLWIELRKGRLQRDDGTPYSDAAATWASPEVASPYSYDSPYAVDGATLRLDATTATGYLLIQGVHTTNDPSRFNATGTPNLPLTFPTP